MAQDTGHDGPRRQPVVRPPTNGPDGPAGRRDTFSDDRFGATREERLKADRSVGSLLKELVDEGRQLLRDEVQLARTETTEKVHRVTSNLGTIAIGAGVLITALLVLGTAATAGVIAVFQLFVPDSVAIWLGPLVLGLLLAAIGYAMLQKGVKTIQQIDPIPRRTVASTKETASWLKDRP